MHCLCLPSAFDPSTHLRPYGRRIPVNQKCRRGLLENSQHFLPQRQRIWNRDTLSDRFRHRPVCQPFARGSNGSLGSSPPLHGGECNVPLAKGDGREAAGGWSHTAGMAIHLPPLPDHANFPHIWRSNCFETAMLNLAESYTLETKTPAILAGVLHNRKTQPPPSCLPNRRSKRRRRTRAGPPLLRRSTSFV